MPPSVEVLRARLAGRGTDSEEVIEKRMKTALDEIACAKNYDYIVVNDDIATAVDDIISVISGNRLKLDNQKHIINEVLEKC